MSRYLIYCLTISYITLSIIFKGYNKDVFAPANKSLITQNIVLKTDTSDTLDWPRPRFHQRYEERRKLVNSLGPRITDQAVREAMRQVPRHLFIPEAYRPYAYENRALPIGYNQTISQPFVVAYMTQLLNLEVGEKVLEIGTGSGYQAAVLSELTPYVFTVEIVEALGRQARARFDSLGYTTIKTKIGDGYQGWETSAPFDAIILTAAPPEVPQPLVDQLRRGGILVAPVGSTDGIQMLTRITKLENGQLKTEETLPVRFVPMIRNGDQNN